MELKEYLKEMVEKVDTKEDEEAILAIFVTEEMNFKYHDECFADFQDDFVIMYDKVTGTNIVIPYDKISVMQYMTKETMKKQAEQLDIKEIFKKLMED
jgi:hypothetical protein